MLGIQNKPLNCINNVYIKPTDQSHLTIYHNLTQVSDGFEAFVDKGTNEIQYSPLMDEAISDSVNLFIEDGSGHIFTQSVDKNTFSIDRYLNQLLGHKVTTTLKDGKNFCGKLIDVSQQGCILTVGSRVVFVDKNDLASITLPEELDQNFFNSFTAHYQTEQKEKISGEINYLAQGITWEGKHQLVIVEEEGLEAKALLTSYAQIENRTSQVFENAIINVVSGQANFNSYPQPIGYKNRNALCTSAQGSAEMAAVDLLWQEYQAFLVPYKIDLKPSQSLKVALYEPKTVELSKRYVNHSYEHETGLKRPQIHYKADNSSNNGLYRAFPKGQVQVYKKEGSTSAILGQSSIAALNKGQDLDIAIGQANGITLNRSFEKEPIKSYSGDVIAQKIHVKIEISNHKNHKIDLELIEHLPRFKSLKDANVELKEITQDKAKIVLNLEPQKEGDKPYLVEYTYIKDLKA